jgi:hypothetical protein
MSYVSIHSNWYDSAAPSQFGGIDCFQVLFQQQQQPIRALADHSQDEIRLWWWLSR